MKYVYKLRRLGIAFIVLIGAVATLATRPELYEPTAPTTVSESVDASSAAATLEKLPVKGRAPKTDYSRSQFGDGWATKQGCDMRNTILYRDLSDVVVNGECQVMSGTLSDPYTGETIQFVRGATTSDDVQIDHVVALSNAWQTGAQGISRDQREQFANDALNLLAVGGAVNQQKSDGDAATWLPGNKSFRCQFVARQIAVKSKYSLWVTSAEKAAMERILTNCPNQKLPIP